MRPRSIKFLISSKNMFEFDSRMTLRGTVKDDWSVDVIKNEPMLFNCDLNAANELGGPITHAILDALPDDWKTVPTIIDSRVHMLKKNWWPCIPGYHGGDVPRSRPDGQPNYHNPEYHSEHLMVLINGGICPTEFALGKSSFPDIEPGEIYYKKWHPIVEQKILDGELVSIKASSGKLIQFDWRTWHKETAAITD